MNKLNLKSNDFLNSQAIQDFVSTYESPTAANNIAWELLLAAMGSDHADMWSKKDRANMMLYIELLQQMIKEVFRLADNNKLYINSQSSLCHAG